MIGDKDWDIGHLAFGVESGACYEWGIRHKDALDGVLIIEPVSRLLAVAITLHNEGAIL